MAEVGVDDPVDSGDTQVVGDVGVVSGGGGRTREKILEYPSEDAVRAIASPVC
jgi:hypothetical protein